MPRYLPKDMFARQRATEVQKLRIPLNVSAPTGMDLGVAGSYGVLADSTITNTGNTVITGDLALYPGTSVVGFPPGTVSGTQDVNNGAALAAKNIATATYVDLSTRPGATDISGIDLGTLTLSPGIYSFSTSAQLTGTLTLDAGGDADAQWIFQIGSTLTTASASVVSIINGGQPGNVFWAVGSSATLGTTTDFAGTIIAQVSITLNTGASLDGRAWALTGAVTLDDNAVSVATGSPVVPGVATSDEMEILYFRSETNDQITAQLEVDEDAVYTQAPNDALGIMNVLVVLQEQVEKVMYAKLIPRGNPPTAAQYAVLGSATGITVGTNGGGKLMLTLDSTINFESAGLDACLEVGYITKQSQGPHLNE